MRKSAMICCLPSWCWKPTCDRDGLRTARDLLRSVRASAGCVKQVCQIVCEMKKETKTCWCVECKEICPLMPGCHHGCCDCPPPRCGHPKCVKKLVKKEYQVDVPVYKCVVLHLCPECCNGGSTNVPATAPVLLRRLRHQLFRRRRRSQIRAQGLRSRIA